MKRQVGTQKYLVTYKAIEPVDKLLMYIILYAMKHGNKPESTKPEKADSTRDSETEFYPTGSCGLTPECAHINNLLPLRRALKR